MGEGVNSSLWWEMHPVTIETGRAVHCRGAIRSSVLPEPRVCLSRMWGRQWGFRITEGQGEARAGARLQKILVNHIMESGLHLKGHGKPLQDFTD